MVRKAELLSGLYLQCPARLIGYYYTPALTHCRRRTFLRLAGAFCSFCVAVCVSDGCKRSSLSLRFTTLLRAVYMKFNCFLSVWVEHLRGFDMLIDCRLNVCKNTEKKLVLINKRVLRETPFETPHFFYSFFFFSSATHLCYRGSTSVALSPEQCIIHCCL